LKRFVQLVLKIPFLLKNIPQYGSLLHQIRKRRKTKKVQYHSSKFYDQEIALPNNKDSHNKSIVNVHQLQKQQASHLNKFRLQEDALFYINLNVNKARQNVRKN